MRYLDAKAVHTALPYPELLDALLAAHCGPMPLSKAVIQSDPCGGRGQFLSLPAWKPGGAIAVKLVGMFPDNPSLQRPEPSVQGLVALFDGETGTPRLIADGSAMTERKTAADSGLGTRLLARPNVRRLLMIGAGAMAPHLIAAHRAARPSIDEVTLWNRSRARAEALAETFAGQEGMTVRVADDLDAAVSQAEVISCATLSLSPLIRGASLQPGTHVDLVGSYRPDMREADDETIRRSSLFVDSRAGALESGDILEPIRTGLIGPDAIRADLFELARRAVPARTSADEITLFKNGGGGHLDLFVAETLWDRLGR